MGDHEPGLTLLPGEADQGRAEDVRPQEREQDREPLVPIDPLLHGRVAVARLEERRVRQDAASVRRQITASLSEDRNR